MTNQAHASKGQIAKQAVRLYKPAAMTCWSRKRQLLLFAAAYTLWLCTCVAPVAAAPALGFATSNCSAVTLRAQHASCTPQGCHLQGKASLRCGELHLQADAIDVLADDRQQFAGAVARGGVQLNDAQRVLTCETLQLQANAVCGQVHGVRVSQKSGSENGEPSGYDEMVVTGSVLQRDAKAVVRLHDATFTLCDCGLNKPPSWQLRAPAVTINAAQTRATVYWPTLRVNLWGARMLPLTPPLLPISLPLVPRAAGLLLPQLQFLGPPYPTIDLPLFLPLGPSVDLTIAPGVRADWRGAPRLSARVRARPSQRLSLEANVADTWDYAGSMAQKRAARDLLAQPELQQQAAWQDLHRQRQLLRHRVSLDLRLQAQLLPMRRALPGSNNVSRAEWLVDGAWVSDDLVFADLSVIALQRSMAYLPSRSVAVLRRTDVVVTFASDMMLQLHSQSIQDGVVQPQLSNVYGAEANTLHRLPAVSVYWPRPLHWGPLSVDVAASMSRYGPWRAATDAAASSAARQVVSGLTISGNYHQQLGFLHLRGTAVADSLWVGTAGSETFLNVAPLADAEASFVLARAYPGTLHSISPYVRARALIQPRTLGPSLAGAASLELDERLQRRGARQLQLGLRQNWWRGSSDSMQPIAALEVAVPIDMKGRQLLQPWLTLSLNDAVFGQLNAQMSIDPQQLRQRGLSAAMRELSVAYTYSLSGWQMGAAYNRLSPNADRFLRSLYELAGPRLPQQNSPWVHSLRLHANVQIRQRAQLAYAVGMQLPLPQTADGGNAASCRGKGMLGRGACITSHAVSLGYESACRCWHVDGIISAAPQDFWHTFRFMLVLNVAGFRVGATPKR